MIVADNRCCKECHLIKPLDQFGADSRKLDKKSVFCLVCQREKKTQNRRGRGIKAKFNVSSISTEDLPKFDTNVYYLGRLC
jgi:hypothetical protein